MEGGKIGKILNSALASLVVQMVKNPTVMQQTWVRSLGWEDPLQKKIQSNILACRIPQAEKPGRLQSMESQIQTQVSD